LAGHWSDRENVLKMQRRHDLNAETDWVAAKYVTTIQPVRLQRRRLISAKGKCGEDCTESAQNAAEARKTDSG